MQTHIAMDKHSIVAIVGESVIDKSKRGLEVLANVLVALVINAQSHISDAAFRLESVVDVGGDVDDVSDALLAESLLVDSCVIGAQVQTGHDLVHVQIDRVVIDVAEINVDRVGHFLLVGVEALFDELASVQVGDARRAWLESCCALERADFAEQRSRLLSLLFAHFCI